MSDKSMPKAMKAVIEIAAIFCLFFIMTKVFYAAADAFHLYGIWTSVLIYVCLAAAIVLYVLKVEKKPLSDIGLKRPVLSDFPKGLALGLSVFVVSLFPLVFLPVNFSDFAVPPDWGNIIRLSLYGFFCTGFTEELMLRGFVLHKTEELCSGKAVVITVNCLLYYALYFPSVHFQFGLFYQIVVITVLLCVSFYKSPNKSIVPLMIAHGLYNVLASLLPMFCFYLQ